MKGIRLDVKKALSKSEMAAGGPGGGGGGGRRGGGRGGGGGGGGWGGQQSWDNSGILVPLVSELQDMFNKSLKNYEMNVLFARW